MSGTSTSTTVAPVPPQVISFNEIPYNIQVPGTYVEIKANFSQAGLLGYSSKALIIGQMLTNVNAAPNTPYPINSSLGAAALFGQGSIASQMCAAFLAANPWTELDAIGVPDAAGAAAATGGWVIAGTATQAGAVALYLQGIRVALPVNVGDTAATVAAQIYSRLSTNRPVL